jgi:CHASE3 domain sensor protein
MLALIGLIAAWTLREVYGADSWVDHTYEVMRTSEQLFSELQDAQIAVRGYLLSSEDSDLAPYHTAIAKIPESFRSLKNLTSGYVRTLGSRLLIRRAEQNKTGLSRIAFSVSAVKSRMKSTACYGNGWLFAAFDSGGA